jgi:hypothetical protein
MKKKSVNPKMAMMAARARRMPAVRPDPMAPPMAMPPTMPTGMPPAMPGMKKGGMSKGCATKSDAKMIAKKEVKGHESSMHKMKMGGKCMATGGKASQLSKANGIAVRGKTKGKMC